MPDLSIVVKEEMVARLDQEAGRLGISRSDLVRLAIVDYLTRVEKESKNRT